VKIKMADVTPTPVADSGNGDENGGEKIVRSVFKAIFPALLLGLIGMILFLFVADLFSMINNDTTFMFSNQTFMAIFGFFVGFGGYLGLKFEEYI
jgi:hypothetical protein